MSLQTFLYAPHWWPVTVSEDALSRRFSASMAAGEAVAEAAPASAAVDESWTMSSLSLSSWLWQLLGRDGRGGRLGTADMPTQ